MRGLVSLVLLAAFQGSTSLDTLLTRLDQYMRAYEPRLSQVVADEEMTQVRPGSTIRDFPYRRHLKSEVAFVQLRDDATWLGYRSVKTADGRSVSDQTDWLRSLLASGLDERRRAAEIARASASHNLGNPRTTNMPTLPLELLHARNRHRVQFRLEGPDVVSRRRLQKLSFEETTRPTLIRSFRDEDIRCHGTVWIEEATGRIFEVEVRMSAANTAKGSSGESMLRVSFEEHRTLDLLVPVRMRETFPVGSLMGSGEARYSNFRLFATSARIIQQP
jgi:hypothetical protein